MLLDYPSTEETVLPKFKGGEKELAAKMFFDGTNRILQGRLIPGASIGRHRHETDCEIMLILSGTATIEIDGTTETLTPGMIHYCPKGSTHETFNRGSEDLIFFAVVPQQ